MFSDAISSISWRWRPSSPLIAAAISGSACSSVAVKNESGAEAVLALEGEGHMDEISPPPQPVRQGAVGHGWRSEAALGGYHIGPQWPSACGAGLLFMQDMVGMGWLPASCPGRDAARSAASQNRDPSVLRKCGSRFCSAPFAALMLRCARDTIPAPVATPLLRKP